MPTRKSAMLFVLLFCCSSLLAQKGTLTLAVTSWNGIQRTYSVYLPPVLQANPAMVLCLHPTETGPASQMPVTWCQQTWWESVADTYGFILVSPVATWKPNGTTGSGWFFWQSFGTDTFFPTVPDDAGFLRSLIQSVAAQYGAHVPVFVVGSSSGGMMTESLAIESSDLIAAIAPVSTVSWVNNAVLPPALNPVSVLEYHGDADQILNYCGGKFTQWGEKNVPSASMDEDVSYWLAQDGLAANTTPLCTNGAPTPGLMSLDFKGANGVEVEFLRQIGMQHGYSALNTAAIWAFFAAHGR